MRKNSLMYGIFVLAVAAVGLAGYVGYVVYPRFGLPASTGVGLAGLAAAAGIASFFSPCSFPLLMTLLVRDTSAYDPKGVRLRQALWRAAWIAAGAATFMLSLGLLIAAGGSGFAASVTFGSTIGRSLRAIVGIVLIVFGLIQIGKVRVNLRQLQPASHRLLKHQASLRRSRPVLGYLVFGFAYLVAGFG